MSVSAPANRMHDLAIRLQAVQVKLPADLVTRLEQGKPTTADYRAVQSIEKSLEGVGRTDGVAASLDALVHGARKVAPNDVVQYDLARALRTAIGQSIGTPWLSAVLAAVRATQ